jgi:hypothetical protein
MPQITGHVLILLEKYDELISVFALQTNNPTGKLLKLCVRVVNQIHFIENGNENRK